MKVGLQVGSFLLLVGGLSACALRPGELTLNESEAVSVVLPSGAKIRVWTVPNTDEHDEDEDDKEATSELGGSGDGYTFLGKARKAAKLSISAGTGHKFASVCDFLKALPSDDDMRALHISKAEDSGRVKQEEFNAAFPAYVLASSYPADNDFHVILADDSASPKCLLNVEVSGLPSSSTDPSYATLSQVRKDYIACMGTALPSGGYKIYKPGIKMVIMGSGFFDVSHGSGTIGPAGLKPATAWELHPVTSLSCK